MADIIINNGADGKPNLVISRTPEEMAALKAAEAAIEAARRAEAATDDIEKKADKTTLAEEVARAKAAEELLARVKQNVIADLEAIREGAAKGATALQEHQSLDGKQYKLSLEQLANIADVVNKVTKEEGKGLSTNDFTDALKNKLDGLSNYNDKAVRDLIDGLTSRLNTLVGSEDATTAIDTFNEIVSFLANIQDTQTLEGILNGINLAIGGKQDAISDLAAIRSGAAKGATALQSQDIVGKADKKAVVDNQSATTITLTAVKNTNYTYGTLATLNLTFPSQGTNGDEIDILFTSGSTATALVVSEDNALFEDFVPEANMVVEVNAVYYNGKWVVLFYQVSND